MPAEFKEVVADANLSEPEDVLPYLSKRLLGRRSRRQIVLAGNRCIGGGQRKTMRVVFAVQKVDVDERKF